MTGELEIQADSCLMHVIRHGATAHNLLSPPRMQGHAIDQSLAPRGQEQAVRVAKAMSPISLSAVYSSPMRRALETAQAIAEPHSLVPVPIDGLLEADVGRWEDRGWDEIEANDAEAYRLFREDPVANGYPDGENLGVVLERVMIALRVIATRHQGEQVVVVAHSVVNRLILGEFLQVPIALRHRVPQSNCGWSQIRWRKRGPRVLSVNEVQHLRD